MKFLIIDDEFFCRAILRNFLKDHGQCDVAVDGLEMIEAFEISLKADAPYDFLFLDVMMPQMDGIDALKKIRELETLYGIEKESQSKVVMTTALSDKETLNRCEAFSISGFLNKPLSRDAIHKIILD